MSTNRETSHGLWQSLPHRWTELRHRSRTGRFEVALPPYEQTLRTDGFDLAAADLERHAAQAELRRFEACQVPGRYLFTEGNAEIPPQRAFPAEGYADFFRTLTRELGLTPASEPSSTAQLLARVSAMRAEVTAMHLALDEGRDPCECGTWQVTWDASHQRWICSDCADNAALYETWQIGPAPEYEGNECIDYRPAAARTTEQRSIDYRCSRERFVREYVGYGLDIVRPEDHIRLTGV